MTADVESGRAAFARRDWASAHASLSGGNLGADDLELLAVAAYLLGHDRESTVAWEEAHRAWAARGELDRAARCAAWLALMHLLRGEAAVGSGWLARADRLMDEAGRPCAARGLTLVPMVLAALGDDDAPAAAELASEMVSIGKAFDDADVLAFGLLTSGEAAIAGGDLAHGMRLFDEVMVAVAAAEVSPLTAGIVYCAVVDACMRAFDLQRAAEWTAALHDWCSEQPDLVPYRGQCLVHRAQVMQARGAWSEATVEADRARRLLSDPTHPALAIAVYQRGELHRVRGELDEAEHAFRESNRLGLDPLPGFALLRLAQGRTSDAVASALRMLDAPAASYGRPSVLSAAAEVFLASGDLERARAASEELSELAGRLKAPMLEAAAAYASGTLLLAEGRAPAALTELRRAGDRARQLDLRYDEARARARLGDACRALGDSDAADLEHEAAMAAFAALGARVDLERERGAGATPVRPQGTLTARECDVLRLVAGGHTNREIAGELGISEHTVARHLQNIFTKLGLSSRAAATAHAYECGLLGPRGQNQPR